MPPTTASPAPAPGDEVGREVGPDQRPGHEPAAQLREHDHRVGAAEPDAARRLALAQREHAHLGELAPERAVEALLLELAQRLDRHAPVAERAHARRAAPPDPR